MAIGFGGDDDWDEFVDPAGKRPSLDPARMGDSFTVPRDTLDMNTGIMLEMFLYPPSCGMSVWVSLDETRKKAFEIKSGRG